MAATSIPSAYNCANTDPSYPSPVPISFPIKPPPPRLGNKLEIPRVSSPLPWPVCTPPPENTSRRIAIVFPVHQIESGRPVRSPSTSSSPRTSPTSAVDCRRSSPPPVFSSSTTAPRCRAR
ncbi:hypothetical protein VPH35_065996 [Triticum aestivum]